MQKKDSREGRRRRRGRRREDSFTETVLLITSIPS
jgi:hypothetical protein